MLSSNDKREGRIIRILAMLLMLSMLTCGCAQTNVPDTTGGTDTDADTSQGTSADTEGEKLPPPPPDSKYTEDKYKVISKETYIDKTTAGFLSQLAGFLSGHEFAKSSEGKCAVAMPDSKFEYLGGLYATDPRCDKHIKHVTSELWEVWFDDDFSVDVVNQYILSDMYKQKFTVCQKLITDGWINYDVWDMGGGQRKAGAYGVISRRNYLPQFAGNTEYDNWYSYLSEPYIATDTLGMNAAGMPETARDLAAVFSSVTGDRDNTMWAQFFSVMISRAYFENDIEELIRSSTKVFPAGSWPLDIIDDVFEVYAKYPDDWRSAYIDFESRHYLAGDTTNTDTDINCGFVVLDLLYGKGDYMNTCKIGSLAGYDCETTCGIALTVLGIMGGTEVLPEETNTYIWQDGRGKLVNLVCPGDKDDQGVWMKAAGLPERMEIKSVIEKYRVNFESVLLEAGGAMDEHYYYIPIESLRSYKSVGINNAGFETGDLSGYTVTGEVSTIGVATTGSYAVKLTGSSSICTKITGLEVGSTYALTAYIRTSGNASAYLFAREVGGADGVCASVSATVGTPKYEAQSTVKRTLTFRASAPEMEIGISMRGAGEEFAVADALSVIMIDEREAGSVKIDKPAENNVYTGNISFTLDSKTKKEVYLKLTFANTTGKIADLPITVNRKKYASAALYKTSAADTMKNADCVYIPLVLNKGENTVSVNLSSSVSIYSAELVEVSARY